MLWFLDQQSALPFPLSRVVEWTLTRLLSGAVTAPMIAMLERIERDFPNLACVSSLFVRCMFLKAERDSIERLDEVKSMMRGHKVRKVDVSWACLRNGCRSAIALRYAITFGKDFDLQSFVEGTLTHMIYQPYRGIMLRELDRLFRELGSTDDFHAMLETAVESQGKDRKSVV